MEKTCGRFFFCHGSYQLSEMRGGLRPKMHNPVKCGIMENRKRTDRTHREE